MWCFALGNGFHELHEASPESAKVSVSPLGKESCKLLIATAQKMKAWTSSSQTDYSRYQASKQRKEQRGETHHQERPWVRVVILTGNGIYSSKKGNPPSPGSERQITEH